MRGTESPAKCLISAGGRGTQVQDSARIDDDRLQPGNQAVTRNAMDEIRRIEACRSLLKAPSEVALIQRADVIHRLHGLNLERHQTYHAFHVRLP